MKKINVKKSIYIATYVAIILGAAYKIYRKVAVKEKPKKESRQKPLYGIKVYRDQFAAANSDPRLDLAVSDAIHSPIPRVVAPKTPFDTIWARTMANDIHRKFSESVLGETAQGGISAAIDRALESHYAGKR